MPLPLMANHNGQNGFRHRLLSAAVIGVTIVFSTYLSVRAIRSEMRDVREDLSARQKEILSRLDRLGATASPSPVDAEASLTFDSYGETAAPAEQPHCWRVVLCFNADLYGWDCGRVFEQFRGVRWAGENGDRVVFVLVKARRLCEDDEDCDDVVCEPDGTPPLEECELFDAVAKAWPGWHVIMCPVLPPEPLPWG